LPALGTSKGGFHPGILFSLSFLFFSSLGRLKRGFQPNDGTQALHGGFDLSPYIFISLFFLQ